MNKRIFLINVPDEIRQDVEDGIADLIDVGLIEQKIERIPEGLKLTVDAEEWRQSWESTGCPVGGAEAFADEIIGWIPESFAEKIKVEEIKDV